MPEGSIVGWLAIGLVAGVLGRLLIPGRGPGGFVVTILIGIAGALFGGFLLGAAGIPILNAWHACGAAAVGSILLLLLYRVVLARRIS